MPKASREGLATLQEILRLAPHTKVIVVTGNADRDNAVRAVGLGAYDFYSKPVDTDVLRLIVDRAFHIAELEEENRQLRDAQSAAPLEGIIATDAGDAERLPHGREGRAHQRLGAAARRKRHRQGAARRAPSISAASGASERFVAINCAAIPEQLLESELFGYEKGAFTGAVKQTLGKVETAEGGTLFLDEIGDMPLSLQAKLLRFLQDRVIERVGGRQEIPVDVRVVCATHQDLKALIAAQQFRQDLFYRISEVHDRVAATARSGPATRWSRAGAVASVVAANRQARRAVSRDEALAAIQRHDWPGNVRELENKVRTAVIMATERSCRPKTSASPTTPAASHC